MVERNSRRIRWKVGASSERGTIIRSQWIRDHSVACSPEIRRVEHRCPGSAPPFHRRSDVTTIDDRVSRVRSAFSNVVSEASPTIRSIRSFHVARHGTTKPRLDYWLVSRDVSATFVPGEIHPGRRQSGGRWTVRRTSRPPYGEPLEPGGGKGGAVEVVEEEGPRTCNKLRGHRRYRRHRCRRHRPRHDVTWIS